MTASTDYDRILRAHEMGGPPFSLPWRSFGFAAQPSGGRRSVGTELDAVIAWRAARGLTLEAGYCHLFGHAVFDGFDDEDTRFGYVMLTLRH